MVFWHILWERERERIQEKLISIPPDSALLFYRFFLSIAFETGQETKDYMAVISGISLLSFCKIMIN